MNANPPRHFSYVVLAAATAVALTACSKSGADVTPSNASANAPTSVAVTPAIAPPAVVSQNNSAYDQGRRDQERRDTHQDRHDSQDRMSPPRTDRDASDGVRSQEGDQQRGRHDGQVAAACQDCGVIESIDAVQMRGETNGVGAVAGGVGGALIGNRIAGSHDRTIGGVVGAVGGGLIGNAIEKHERTNTVYDVHVRMSDGSLRTVRQATAPAVGAKVRVEADGLHDRA